MKKIKDICIYIFKSFYRPILFIPYMEHFEFWYCFQID